MLRAQSRLGISLQADSNSAARVLRRGVACETLAVVCRPSAGVRLGLALVALALTAACGSADDSAAAATSAAAVTVAASSTSIVQQASSTEPAAASPALTTATVEEAESQPLASPSKAAQSLIQSWRAATSASKGTWPGYDLAAIPTVLVSIDPEGAVTAVVAFNHPNPDPLGGPIHSLSIGGHEAAIIARPADPDALAAKAPFDFYADIGGIDTFVLIGQQGDPATEPGAPAFAALLAHETFHRFQFDNWSEAADVHNLDGYDFSQASLGFALLENRILITAYETVSEAETERLARQFAAVRALRHADGYSAGLDEQQERAEGSARYLEHLIGDSLGNSYASGNHPGEIMFYDGLDAEAAAQTAGIKSFFGFGRFYSSGATLLALLDRLGVSIGDIATGLRDGITPAQMLEQHVSPSGDTRSIVETAWAEHDPDGRLREIAAVLADRAQLEDDAELGAETPIGSFEVSDDQIACLMEHGLDVAADNFTIPGDVAQACFSDADDSR